MTRSQADGASRGLKVAVLSLAVSMFSLTSAPAATPPDTLVVAANLDAVVTFDVGRVAEAQTNEILTSVCDPLFRLSPTDSSLVEPMLAEGWEVSSDGLALTVTLREQARFATGRRVASKDVVFTLHRLLELDGGSATLLKEWGFTAADRNQQIVALDDRRVRFALKEPWSPDLVVSAALTGVSGWVLDSETVAGRVRNSDNATGWLQNNTACAGPFRLTIWNASEVIVLERNQTYWRAQPKINRIVFQHVPESGAQRLQLQRGDVDVALGLNAADLAAVERGPNTRVERAKIHILDFLLFQAEDQVVRNPKVWEAFRYLIDYKAIHDTIYAYGGIPRNVPVPIGATHALSEGEGLLYRLDLDRARALLAEAGYSNGLTISLNVGTNPGIAPIATTIQENAARVNVNVQINQRSQAEHTRRFRERAFQAHIHAWLSTYPDADSMLSRLAFNPDNRLEANHNAYPTWRASWIDPELNEMVRAARFERVPARRAEMYREIQLRHAKSSPFLIFSQRVRNVAIARSVTSIPINSFVVTFSEVTK
jgi:peptide/nickel transport system substrate-binding protein